MDVRTILRWILPKPAREALRSARIRVRMRRIGVRKLERMPGVVYLGSAHGGYAVPAELVRGRTGLSFGAGEDISFEVGLARELGATVHIYDPTPRAVEHCRGVIAGTDAKWEGRLFIHPHGVWSECKVERFFAPSDPGHVSHSIVNLQDTSDYFEAECLSPEEILHRLGLGTVSFVKLNIEGAEYEVMKAMFERDIKPDVVCITFDELHSPLNDGKAADRLRGLIGRFRGASYVPVHSVDCKVTFVRRHLAEPTGVEGRTKKSVMIIQRIIPHYRVPLFRRLSEQPDLDVAVVHGTKSLNSGHVAHGGRLPFKAVYAEWYRLSLFGLTATLQPGSLSAVRSLAAHIVIAEGTFNILTNLLVGIYCRLTGRRFIWWVGAWERPEGRAWARRLIRCYTRLAMWPADAFIAYGTYARDYLIGLGAPSEKVHIAHNTIDTDEIDHNAERYVREGLGVRRNLGVEDKKVVLSVGALLRQKRVDTLIRAYARVRSRHDDAALVIVGDGSCRKELEELVEDLSVKDITFVGRMEQSNPYFAMADLFVLPGLGGLALNQAMAFGKPVICSEADGTERDLVIEGVNGHIVTPGDEAALEEAMADLLADGDRLAEMGRASRRIVREKVNFRNMVDGIGKAIDSACD